MRTVIDNVLSWHPIINHRICEEEGVALWISSTDVALLSRIQFALTVAYHFIFVPLSIGLGLITAIFATKYYRSAR